MKKYAERSEAKKKNTEQLKEGLKSSILGPQNLGSGGARAPRAPLDPLVNTSPTSTEFTSYWLFATKNVTDVTVLFTKAYFLA